MAEEQKKDPVEIKVETEVVKDGQELSEQVEEAVAKYFENQAIREKRFNLTGSATDEAKAKAGKKFESTIKFLNALKEGDAVTLKNISNERAKALNEGTSNQGGFLVPDEFERSIVEYMDDFSEIRRNSTVLPMATDVKRLNELTAKVAVFVEGELATMTYSEPTFGEPVLTARRYTGITSMSEELLMDSEIALVQNIARQFGERIAQAEQNQFVNGTFAGGQGLLQVGGVTNVNLGGSATLFSQITWDDLSNMQRALFAVSKSEARTAKFYMSMPVYHSLRTLKASGDGNYFNMPMVPTRDMPASAWGLGIEVLNEFPTATATATKFVVLSDLRNHGFIGDRMGIRIDTSNSATVNNLNMFTNFAQAMRAVKRTAWTTALQNGIVTLSTN